MDMMGETAKAGFQASWQMPAWNVATRNSLLHTLGLAVAVFGITVMLSGVSYAGDDDDEQPADQSFVKKLIEGLGGQNMDDSRIEYRERSPLVVPQKIDLPPPASRKTRPTANWPKDPDEQARLEAIAASKEGPADPIESTRVLLPSELAMHKPKNSSKTDTKPEAAVPYVNQILAPSQLGYKGGMFSGIFGGTKEEKTTFKEEPKREVLTQPPVGYQTPSPSYAYGTGTSDVKTQEIYNPITDKGTIQR